MTKTEKLVVELRRLAGVHESLGLDAAPGARIFYAGYADAYRVAARMLEDALAYDKVKP